MLTQAQREAYFNDGYILLPAIIGDAWVARLRAATEELVERRGVKLVVVACNTAAAAALEADAVAAAAVTPNTIRVSGAVRTAIAPARVRRVWLRPERGEPITNRWPSASRCPWRSWCPSTCRCASRCRTGSGSPSTSPWRSL